jgi:spoIIIJ-associated protein
MKTMEWVEVRGKSADIAIEAAMKELGASDRQDVDIEVMQEPEKGFLGFGGQDAIVKVKLKPKDDGRKRRRRRKKGGGDGKNDGRDQGRRPSNDRGQGSQSSPKQSGDRQSGGRNRNQGGGGQKPGSDRKPRQREEKPDVDIEEQAPVVEEFLTGLVSAFGLEGAVSVRVDDEVIIADVTGPQTEAMVGPRGSTIEAIHELSKTVLQRQTQSSARLRLDIAGYGERRRQALAIYANQLIDQLLEDGGEVTLEPMSAGDRKVIHDAAAERTGVRSYSEGQSPQRYVVLAVVGSDEEE